MTNSSVPGPYTLLREVYQLPAIPRPIIPKPTKRIKTLEDILARTILTSTGCREWNGNIDPITHYGRVSVNGKVSFAHRLVAFYTQVQHPGWRSYLMSKRKIVVCHTCDNPSCIEPTHLLIGTAQYNTLDSIVKGHKVHLNQEYNTRSIDFYEEIAKILLD